MSDIYIIFEHRYSFKLKEFIGGSVYPQYFTSKNDAVRRVREMGYKHVYDDRFDIKEEGWVADVIHLEKTKENTQHE